MDNSLGVNHLSLPSIYESKTRFMKCLNKIFKGGSGGGGSGDPQLLDDDNLLRRTPCTSLDDRQRGKKDREEVDCADDLNGRGGHKWRKDNDASTSRGLPDNMYMPSYPPHMPSYPPYDPPPVPYNQRGSRLCSGCYREIGYGNHLERMDTFFHPECFRCHSCDSPITEREFSLSGRDPYHKSCFKELTQPKFKDGHQFDDRQRGQKDREEVGRVAALSLADDLNSQGGNKSHTDNNVAARGVQDSSHRPSSSPCIPSFPPYDPAPASYYQRRSRLCGGCNHEIKNGNYLGVMGTFFHPDCFRCRSCCYPITGHEFCLSGRDPYHKSCFKELTHPKCEVCHQFVPTNAAGLIEYKCYPYWSQKYCSLHEHDNTARCCSCERLESWNARYIALGDGRNLCMECMESAIMDTGDCQPLYHAIRDYYEGLNMRINQQIPMLLVERRALNEAIVGEKNGHHHLPETKSLCLSEEQIITGILKRPRIGGHQLVGMRTQPKKLTRRCEVTAILVLYGLPRLLTGAILAHELMNGWLRLQGFRNLSSDVEKGICQYLSYMWLESEVPNFVSMLSTSTSVVSSSCSFSSKKGGTSEVEQKLGRFFMHQIENDASRAYGGGFRAACAAVNKYGLRSTLDHIRLTGSFPK